MLSADDYMQFPDVAPDFNYVYGDNPLQFGDLYLPAEGTSHPVIVLVHGGCYREQYHLKPMGTIAQVLVRDGFAVWSIEYRRSGNGGEWPHIFLDVAHATDYLRQIAPTHNLDLTQVITVGHSAGGHLAMWIAGRHKLDTSSALYIDNPLPIQHVVGLAGILDLTRATKVGICSDALLAVLGGTPDDVPDHYQQASPQALLPMGVPHTHIYGELDTEMLDNARPTIDSAKEAGDKVELIVVPDAGHFEIVSTADDAWGIVRDTIVATRP